MSEPCAWCLNVYRADSCQFPRSDQCRTERRLEDMAHVINRPILAGGIR